MIRMTFVYLIAIVICLAVPAGTEAQPQKSSCRMDDATYEKVAVVISKNRSIIEAACRGRTDIGTLLLKNRGADVNSYDDAGRWTPLMHAAYGGHEGFVRLLLSHGANPVMKSKDGKTAADLAREQGYTDIADLIDTSAKSFSNSLPSTIK